jgi:hypothetical protein
MKGGAVRKVLALVLISAFIFAGCSGGGGGYGGSSGGSSSGGSSGGSSSGGTCCGNQVPLTAGPPNVEPLVVDQGPAASIAANSPAINTAFVTIQVCATNAPGTCATIDHIQVDTGSSGLRLVAGALSSGGITGGPALLAALQAKYVTNAGNVTMTNCVPFAIGFSYGSLTTTNITLPVSTETANGVVTQLIGDPNYVSAGGGNIPLSCSNPGNASPAPPEMDDVVSFGANGLLGVGISPDDSSAALYYACGPCTTASNPVAPVAGQIVQNPVTLFAMDNNGTIVQLPAVPNAGTTNPTSPPGVIVFGIGTEANNKLGSAKVLAVNLQNPGMSGPAITAVVNGTTYNDSFLDSGTNFLGISGAAVPGSLQVCSSANNGPGGPWYCTNSGLVAFTATAYGQTGNPPVVTAVSQNADFSIGDTLTAFTANNGNNTAVPNLGGQNGADPESVDFGLPFFYGRYVFTAIEGGTPVAGAPPAPWFAY